MAEHDVRSLADVRLLEVVYGHFPEPFLSHHFHIRVRVVAVDKVANAVAMKSILDHQASRFGWECQGLGRLANVASVADGLIFPRDDLLPFVYARPSANALLQILRATGRLLGEIGRGQDDRVLRRRLNTLAHRMVFTADHAWGWDPPRMRRRLIRHYREVCDVLDRQVEFI